MREWTPGLTPHSAALHTGYHAVPQLPNQIQQKYSIFNNYMLMIAAS